MNKQINPSVIACLLLLIIAACSERVFAQQTDSVNARDSATKVTREYAENYVFADPKQRKIFLQLTAELRCPKCQNQNIADSNAPISHDMRRKVYELMQEGKSKEQIIEWMKLRYGDFVYYQPPLNRYTVWLWLLPIIFAFVMLVFFISRRKVVEQANIDDKIAQADKILKDE